MCPRTANSGLDDVYLTGSAVVNEIAGHWDKYETHVPSAP